MTVFVATFVDQVFDKKSSEVAYLIGVLQTIEKELGRGQGNVTSGTVLGVNAAGVANTSLASWTYTPSATKP
jgi:hypothetical protein